MRVARAGAKRRGPSTLAGQWLAGLALLCAPGCAAGLRPVSLPEPGSGDEAKEPRTARVQETMSSGPLVRDGCYGYVALLDYTTPTAGAKESMPIFRGRRYSACFEAIELGDYVYLTSAHVRSDVWLGIRRDGFVGEKGGWWFFTGKEGKEYIATRLFQGHWGGSKWTTERLMAPEEVRVVYGGQSNGQVHLVWEVGAPEAGIPFERKEACSRDLSASDVVSCAGFSFRVLAADADAITFVLLGQTRVNGNLGGLR